MTSIVTNIQRNSANCFSERMFPFWHSAAVIVSDTITILRQKIVTKQTYIWLEDFSLWKKSAESFLHNSWMKLLLFFSLLLHLPSVSLSFIISSVTIKLLLSSYFRAKISKLKKVQIWLCSNSRPLSSIIILVNVKLYGFLSQFKTVSLQKYHLQILHHCLKKQPPTSKSS